MRQDLLVYDDHRFVEGTDAPAPSAINDSAMVTGLQERAARAVPAEHSEIVEGWWLRYAPSCSWWVGTVLPHGDVKRGELMRRVVRAEEFYAGYGSPAGFQISPPACPEGLDTLLADRGYRRRGVVSLEGASAARVLGLTPTGKFRVRLVERPTRGMVRRLGGGAWS